MPRKPATTRPEPSDEQSTPESRAIPEPTEPPTAGERFFAWLRSIDLRREPGWIGGVCAGIAARIGIDPLIVRGIAVVIAILGGPALLLYAAAWLLIPASDGKLHLEEVFRGRFEPAVAGIAGMLVLAVLPIAPGLWFTWPFLGEPAWGATLGRVLWTAALVGLLVWFVVWIARRSGSAPPPSAGPAAPSAATFTASADTVTAPADAPGATDAPAPADAPPAGASEADVAAWREQQAAVRAEQAAYRASQAAEQRAQRLEAAAAARAARAERQQRASAEWESSRAHPLFSLVIIGLALLAGGAAVIVAGNGEPTPISLVVGLATALAVLAVGIIVNGVMGKRAGGAAGVAWLLLIPLAFTTVATADQRAEVLWGPVMTLEPTSSEQFTVGAGRIELDLTSVEFERSATGIDGAEVSLSVGAGYVTVIVPEDVAVVFTGTVGAGDISSPSEVRSSRVGPVENLTTEFGDVGSGDPVLQVTVRLGAGSVRVIEETGADR